MPIIGQPIRVQPAPIPYWQTADGGDTVRLYLGHVNSVLQRLPRKSIQCVVTSPPYWGLRDYGTDKKFEIGSEPSPDCGTQGKAQCGGCYVCTMVGVFREVYQVLRDDGTIWLNLGDTYSRSSNSGGTNSNSIGHGKGQSTNQGSFQSRQRPKVDLATGNLLGMPWRVALALQADGWVLRQDIIWAKPSPMPESVKTRCTKAHEYVFLLTKAMKYFYDAEAIKERTVTPNRSRAFSTKYQSPTVTNVFGASGNQGNGEESVDQPYSNKRSVWRVAARGYPGAHFATFPPELIRPMILAGTSEYGACCACGAPWTRVVEETPLVRDRPNEYVKRDPKDGAEGVNNCSNLVAGVETRTVGWSPGCNCQDENDTQLGIVPCRVLDPFVGSGTTCIVCLDLGRSSIGIDLSEDYLKNHAVKRVEGDLLSRPALAYLAGKTVKRVTVGRTATVRSITD